MEEIYASTLTCFAISKLLLNGWSDWIKIVHGVTKHTGESQYLQWLYQISQSLHPQSSNVIVMEKPLVY